MKDIFLHRLQTSLCSSRKWCIFFALIYFLIIGLVHAYAQTAPVISASNPPNGYVDPLEDRDATSGTLLGIKDISITFSKPVTTVGGGALSVSNFQVRYYRNGADATDLQTGLLPTLSLVSGSGAGPFLLRFNPRIPLAAWTRITAVNVVDSSGVSIASTGNSIVFGSLPMDTTQDGRVLGDDISRWLQVNGNFFNPTPLSKLQICDQKRNGTIAGEDVTRAIQLINGNGSYRAWNNYNIGSSAAPSTCTYTINPGDLINKYSDVVQPGQTVCIRAGTYSGTLTLQRSGTPGNPITFTAAPGDGCVKSADYHNPPTCKVKIEGGGVYLNSKNYIKIDSLEFRNYGDQGDEGAAIVCRPRDGSGANNLEITNNYIHNESRARDGNGIYCPGTNNSLIAENYITDTGGHLNDNGDPFRGHGIGIRGSNGPLNVIIRKNIILRQFCDGMDLSGTSIVVEDNILGDSFDTDCHQDGLEITTLRNSVIRNNTVYDFTQLIYLSGFDHTEELLNVEISGNVLYTDRYWTEEGGEAPGIFIEGDWNTYINDVTYGNVDNVRIHSNTCVWLGELHNQRWYPCVEVTSYDADLNVRNISIRNNIMHSSGIYVKDSVQNVSSDYNVFFNGAWPLKKNGQVIEGSHSVTANPLFENYVPYTSFNLRLGSNSSPAYESGDPNIAAQFIDPGSFYDETKFYDQNGHLRPQGNRIERGAYERVP